jgi:hypothetical protein
MALADISDPAAIEKAIDEFDRIGRQAFLEKYGIGGAKRYVIQRDGREYDSKAILGAAHGYQFGEPLKHGDFGGGLGSTVPKLKELGFAVEQRSEGRNSFLFQANPRYYDIASAVRTLREMNWTTVQYKNEIEPGDRVYIWQSGTDGGVIAEGTVLTGPKMEREQEGQEFVLDPGKFAGEQLRVRLSIDRVLAEPIRRDFLQGHPELQKLGILRFPNATNFKVSGEEDAVLQSLMGASPSVLEARVEEWLEETAYPTERDDQRKAQRVQLAAALSEENLDQVIEDPEQFDVLEFGQLAHNAYGGPGPMSIVHRHLAEGPEAKRRLAQALRHLLYDDGEVENRIDDVLARTQWGAPGFGEALITKALAVVYPGDWLPLYQYGGEKGKLRLMESSELALAIPESFQEWSPGHRIRWTNDQLRDVTDPYLAGDRWGQMVFLYWLREQQREPNAVESLDSLADRLLVEPGWLAEVVGLLEEKRQIIFQGPPGTGKTYVARTLARHFERLGGGAETVQFHPSYAYEDFVEGYRPKVVAGQPGFELVEGPLKRLAALAEADPEHKYVLVIDELNRGNVAKVFGELYYLLEYRGDRIRLQYGEEEEDSEDISKFGIPRNLWIIATMNTADRSIALMDAALRRRFYFVDFYPNLPPVASLLERWLERNNLQSFSWLEHVLDEANRRLNDHDAAIGPSHFLLGDPDALTDERIERIWKHAVMPYLQERLIGEPERLQEFELELLRAAGSDGEGSGLENAEDGASGAPGG